MNTENYWGTLPDPDSIITPETVLRQQADLLNELTRGILNATLDVRSEATESILIDLDIHAPALGYFFTALTLSGGAPLYPVIVWDRVTGVKTRANNESEYREILKDMLSGEPLKQSLAALIARSKSVGS